MPLSHSELLTLAMKSWKDLSMRYKLITTHLISKNLTQLESFPELLTNDKNISPDGSPAALFSFFLNTDNGSKELKMADRLKVCLFYFTGQTSSNAILELTLVNVHKSLHSRGIVSTCAVYPHYSRSLEPK